MNLNLTKLLVYLKSNVIQDWNYAQKSPTEVYPIIWPEVFTWDKTYDCILIPDKPPQQSYTDFLKSFFGMPEESYLDIFVYMETTIQHTVYIAETIYPSQDEFMAKLEDHINKS
jgi:hypothetical protein